MKEKGFSGQLKKLREEKGLNNTELAKLANVPRTLLAGLQSGRRRVGEYSARKIGAALGLSDEALEAFVLNAIDTCTEKVLKEARDYPASLLNLIPVQLKEANIAPDHLLLVSATGSDVLLYLNNGRKAQLITRLEYM